LARVLLFGVSIYVFLYVRDGPGRLTRRASLRAIRWLYWAGVLSALYACVDFYFQFSPPAGYEQQFVWLDSGVYRRAQGFFYEASTLGNLCAFFLEMVAVALEQGWGVRTASLSYLAVGFGSHHWDVTDDTGARWFASVDELDTRRWSLKEPLDSVFGRLDAGLTAAADLAGLGLRFVLAPTRARNRRALLRLAERFSVALTPFAAGQSFGWGDFDSAEHRRAVLDLVIAVHGAPASARRRCSRPPWRSSPRAAARTPAGPG